MVSKLYKWLIIVPVVIICSSGMVHPIYVSVTEIEYNTKEKTLEISCKIFTDDFEKVLRKNYNKTVDLINPADKAEMNRLVGSYVKKHLKINVDGKAADLRYLGYEIIEEGVYSYYQADNISSIRNLKVTDNILFEYKSEQMNLLHVIVNGNRQSTKLNNPASEAEFRY